MQDHFQILILKKINIVNYSKLLLALKISLNYGKRRLYFQSIRS